MLCLPLSAFSRRRAACSRPATGAVFVLQLLLGSGAPHFANLAPVPLTGEYDAETETAVRVMQDIFGLPQTGVADCATWDMLAGLHNALYERAPLAWALP